MFLQDFLTESARRHPGGIAVVHRDRRWTYAALDLQSELVAARLRDCGVRKGDRVALIARNSGAYVAAYFGILKAAAVVVPVNTQLTEREIAAQLADCRPSAVLAEPPLLDAAGSLAAASRLLALDDAPSARASLSAARRLPASRDDNELAAIFYTSGTTGCPKGVMLTHRNLCANAAAIASYLRLTDRDRVMCVLPFQYSYGNSLLTTHVRAGGMIVIEDGFLYPNAVLDRMVAEDVSGFAGVPSHYALLLRTSALARYRLPKLRYATQAGGAMNPSIIDEFRALLPHVQFFVMYGQTEATARLSYLPPEHLERKRGSVGVAIPGVELEIVDENGAPAAPGRVGEIVARGDSIMAGYWNAPGETRQALRDGWLRTGDLARKDADGFIYIAGRKKDIIKSGAHRISPGEIEDAVVRLGGVLECCAVGVSDEILGEAVKLFVVPDGTVPLSEKDVTDFCRHHLAPYKLPKRVEIVAALPRTSTGKVRYAELRKREREAVRSAGTLQE